MRIECEACGHLGDAVVRPTGSGVELECTSCGHVAMLGGAPPAPDVPDVPEMPARGLRPMSPAAPQATSLVGDAVPEGAAPQGIVVDAGEGEHQCPKCGWRQDDPEACHRCGLAFSRAVMSGAARPWEKVSPSQQRAAEELDRRWEALAATDFLDDSEHDTFIQFASRAKLLERAANRYRLFAQEHPNDPRGERAVIALERIIEMLNATFFIQKNTGGGDSFVAGVGKFKVGIYVVTILMCLALIVSALVWFKPFG